MKDFQFYSPTKFIFGKEAECRAGEVLASYGAKKVMLVHYGDTAPYEGPILDRVIASLVSSGIPYVDFSGIKPNPTAERAQEGAELARTEKIDYLLAVGGGSVIDTAKYIAIATLYDGDVWTDYYVGNKPVAEALPIGAINTNPGTGSESSCSSVVTHGTLKRSCNDDRIRPAFALMNPELTYTLPAFQTASVSVDIMAHVHERYFTRTTQNYLTDNLCESVFRTVIKYLPVALKDPTNYNARAQLTWASNLAHNDTVGVGRGPVDGAVHGIQSEIGGMYDSAHGAGVACVTPGWMRYVYKTDPRRFVRYFTEVWGMENDPFDPEGMILEGIERQKSFYKSVGIPVHSAELGVRDEDIPTLISTTRRSPNGTCGHFMELDDHDLAEIYQLIK